MKTLLLILSISSFTAFGQAGSLNQKTSNSGYNCQLILKTFIKKNGQITETKEYYLRCSTADYFIKLCESNVSASDLEKHLNSSLPAEIEILEGSWDICEDDPAEMQSRIGEYVIIKKLIEND